MRTQHKIDLSALPSLTHPLVDYSLIDAVLLAIGHQTVCMKEEPATLFEAREVVLGMAAQAAASGRNWITGKAALDLLDSAIDGHDLTMCNRLDS